MISVKLSVLVLCCFFFVSLADSSDQTLAGSDIDENKVTEVIMKGDPMAEAYKSLADEDRKNFLAYVLARGFKDWLERQGRPPKFSPLFTSDSYNFLNISKEKIEKFEKMNIPKESSKKYLDWSKKEFSLTTKNIAELVRTGRCSSCLKRQIGIGEICCPW